MLFAHLAHLRPIVRRSSRTDRRLGALIRPKLTTLVFPHYELGRSAVDVLFTEITDTRGKRLAPARPCSGCQRFDGGTASWRQSGRTPTLRRARDAAG